MSEEEKKQIKEIKFVTQEILDCLKGTLKEKGLITKVYEQDEKLEKCNIYIDNQEKNKKKSWEKVTDMLLKVIGGLMLLYIAVHTGLK